MIIYKVDIQKNELHVAIHTDIDGIVVTLRYRQCQDQWQRIKDEWQCFHYAIRRELDNATVTAMLLSQTADSVITAPVDEDLLDVWRKECYHAREKLNMAKQ